MPLAFPSNPSVGDQSTQNNRVYQWSGYAWEIVSNISPAFTGAATVANTGNVVPLTVTNTGTANSFVVNDIASDTSPFIIDASGNVGIRCTPVGTDALDVGGSQRMQGTLYLDDFPSATATVLTFDGDSDTGLAHPSGNVMTWVTGGSERLRIDSSGNVTLATGQLFADDSTSVSAPVYSFDGDANTGIGHPAADVVTVSTGGSERLRVNASGVVLIGQSSTADPAGANTNGVAIATDYISVSRSSFECLRLNIKAADGTIVALYQDATLEGSISVSGNTVSYNAFCGSHWAQLIDGSRPAILRGTVLETIDDMCEWPEGQSDRLTRVQVSNTPASRRVYGVFLAYDDQYAATGDMYAAALGAYMVRVSGVVQSGDLLESAGDGTARAQADDLVRSSTIGKVSSTHRVTTYDDGSYLVPCVLMCG